MVHIKLSATRGHNNDTSPSCANVVLPRCRQGSLDNQVAIIDIGNDLVKSGIPDLTSPSSVFISITPFLIHAQSPSSIRKWKLLPPHPAIQCHHRPPPGNAIYLCSSLCSRHRHPFTVLGRTLGRP